MPKKLKLPPRVQQALGGKLYDLPLLPIIERIKVIQQAQDDGLFTSTEISKEAHDILMAMYELVKNHMIQTQPSRIIKVTNVHLARFDKVRKQVTTAVQNGVLDPIKLGHTSKTALILKMKKCRKELAAQKENRGARFSYADTGVDRANGRAINKWPSRRQFTG